MHRSCMLPHSYTKTTNLNSASPPLLSRLKVAMRQFVSCVHCNACSCWWEVVSLLQRTVLTGWLLLIDNSVPLVRLIIALIIVLSYLVGILVCEPYKNKHDAMLATAIQIIFVFLFLGANMVGARACTFEQPGSFSLTHTQMLTKANLLSPS